MICCYSHRCRCCRSMERDGYSWSVTPVTGRMGCPRRRGRGGRVPAGGGGPRRTRGNRRRGTATGTAGPARWPRLRSQLPNGDRAAYVTAVYEAKVISGIPTVADGELSEVAWFGLEPAKPDNAEPTLPGSPNCRRAHLSRTGHSETHSSAADRVRADGVRGQCRILWPSVAG